jgi:hypothetical protein
MRKNGKKGKKGKKSKKDNAIVYARILKAEKAKETGDYNKPYIGQAKNLAHRNSDFRNLKKAYAGEKLERARKLYGVDDNDWEVKVLFSASYKKESTRKKKLNRIETEMIIKFNAVDEGLNSSYGHGMQGVHHKKETKLKISLALSGVPKSEDHKKAMSKGRKKAKRKRNKNKNKNKKAKP